MGIDRHEDGIFDNDDNCPANANTNQADGDGDGVGDVCDNCQLINDLVANHRDSNGDGYGNRCDADLDQTGFVNSLDLGLFKIAFFSSGPDADFNGDGIVNSIDLGLFKQLFQKQAGPSAIAE